MFQAVNDSTPARPAAGEDVQQYLTFVLGGEVFALDILAIKEIIEYTQLTPVPMTPGYVRGVINLRGAVLPVLDLLARFGKQSTPVSKRTCIIVIEMGAGGTRHDMGIVVDAVNAVLDIASSEIEPPPGFGAHIRTDFIRGMGKVRGQFVILLEVDRILDGEQRVALAQSVADD